MTRSIATFRETTLAFTAAFALATGWTRPTLAESPVPQATSSDKNARAEDLAARAFSAYRSKQHAEAVALYRQAYKISPSADMLYNIARIYDIGLLDRPLAITFYRRYVADPGAVFKRIKLANERLVELKAAEAAVGDSRPVKSLTAFTVATPARVSGAPGMDSATESYWSAWRIGAAVTGALGVVALGAGTGYGLSAMSKANTVDEHCTGNDCIDQRGVDAAISANDHADLATLGFAIGGGLVAGSALLFLLSPDAAHETGLVGELRWSPIASRSSLGASFVGRW